jgi:two-component system sensor histidine kinase TctE
MVTATPNIKIRVCDSGKGFPCDELETLPARFKRGKNAEGTIGSGLGLTIAMDVAKAHSGTLQLSNQPEGGACVSLLL